MPNEGQLYQAGTTVPAIGAVVQTNTGLWVPQGSSVSPAPLDFARTYITLSEVTDGFDVSLDWLRSALNRIPIESAIQLVAVAMAKLRDPGRSDPAGDLDRESLPYFTEPTRSRVARKISDGSLIHAPQLLMVLAKLALAGCPDEVDTKDFFETSRAILLLVLADNLKSSRMPTTIDQTVHLSNELVLELAANTNFNSTYREDSQLALFQRRWIEIPRESPSTYYSRPLDEVFAEATGMDLSDLVSFAIGIWASCVAGNPVVHYPTYFANFDWNEERLGTLITSVSMPIQEYREAIRRELTEHPLDWYFTTFARYPLVRFGKHLVVLDPELVLKRCLGLPPMFHMQQKLEERGRHRESIAVKQAFDEYSEKYARQIFESLAGTLGVKRVYSDSDLKRAYKGLSVADVAVDYGDAWVVVEVTTSQAARNTINAVSVDGLERDRKMVVHEASQIAATIDQLRQNRIALTGDQNVMQAIFYPIIVLTEGFPANPLVTSLMRQEIKAAGLLKEQDIAPLELMDLVELDMIEGVVETKGPALPRILDLKRESSFHADSVRNFLLGDRRFTPQRPRRVTETFRRVFFETIRKMGADPTSFEWRQE
ncbi:hypothetical protein [Phytohabitans houttuyneae]|uniref:hypothetical protein n=1 Tax=Phytohabitans houttuyneae TaxID=1076126 RepID=UPI00156538EF|nr:hypothetical protein [Phytohabitans houttuyneae]